MPENREKFPFEIQEQRDKLAQDLHDIRRQRDEKQKEGTTFRNRILGRTEKLADEAKAFDTEAQSRLKFGKHTIEYMILENNNRYTEKRIEVSDELRKEMRNVGIYEKGGNVYLRTEAINFLNKENISGIIDRYGAGKGGDQLVITDMYFLRELTQDEISSLLPLEQNDRIWYHGTTHKGNIIPGTPRKEGDPSLGGLFLSNKREDAAFYSGEDKKDTKGIVRVFEYIGNKTLEITGEKPNILIKEYSSPEANKD